MFTAEPLELTGQLQLPTLRLVVAAMVAAGQAEYDPRPTKGAQPTGALVYWKKPDEWAQLIYDWVSSAPSERGQDKLTSQHTQVKENGLTGSIMTLYELTEGGDLVHTTGIFRLFAETATSLADALPPLEFYQLPDPILRRALTILEKQGKCSVFRVGGDGEGEEGDGVKFV